MFRNEDQDHDHGRHKDGMTKNRLMFQFIHDLFHLDLCVVKTQITVRYSTAMTFTHKGFSVTETSPQFQTPLVKNIPERKNFHPTNRETIKKQKIYSLSLKVHLRWRVAWRVLAGALPIPRFLSRPRISEKMTKWWSKDDGSGFSDWHQHKSHIYTGCIYCEGCLFPGFCQNLAFLKMWQNDD